MSASTAVGGKERTGVQHERGGRRIILEREVPGDLAFVNPLSIRAIDFVSREKLIDPANEEKAQLGLTEALKNAVMHGSRGDFEKRVKLSVFVSEREWGFLVEDEGDGFDPGAVPSPVEGEGVWGVTGRGVHIMKHCMDRVEFLAGGRAILLVRKR